jgi:heterodisulfide reductase subunit A2
MEKAEAKKIGAVMVVGGGIAGIQASLDLADSGYYVYLVEKDAAVGGTMPQLDKTFPTNDCSMCIISPKLVECGRHLNIEILTMSEVADISGDEGNYLVEVVQKARYVDTSKCIGCGLCAEKCPQKVPNEFNQGLNNRKAAYVLYPQAVPLKYAIDKEHCIYFRKGKCRACEKFCPAGAIDFDQTDQVLKLNVGAVIMAPGFKTFDAHEKPEYGYGRYPNVITSLDFERLLSATGPCAGHVRRPSDGSDPKRIAWIQCVGSRDASCGKEYCSYVCCMYATKQAVIAQEHDNEVESTVFYIDIRAQGKGFDRYYERAKEAGGVRFIRSMVSRVTEDPQTRNPEITYVDETGAIQTEEFDLVVLSVGLTPHPASKDLADTAGIATNRWGFAETPPFELVETSRKGIFTCGAFQSPKDIPDSVAQASAASAAAARLLAEGRGTLVSQAEYPPERVVDRVEPRIGVFVCSCGMNIASTVNVKEVVECARNLPFVAYAENFTFTCSSDSLENMRQKIESEKLNRIVVAACSPRTHESLFMDNLRQAGLNKYLFYMANIRDQDSWVHQQHPEAATQKAKDLVAMAAARVAIQEPLHELPFMVTQKALVIGGGLAGMTAALTIAESGFDVYLVEQAEKLGGLARKVHYTVEGHALQPYLEDLIHRVESQPRIQVLTNTQVKDLAGHVGKFSSILLGPAGQQEIEYGAAVIATGGREYKPTEYLYGEDPRVLTQLELENRLVNEAASLPPEPTVVMIQCVGSREPEHPYCSRICCGAAVKNALKLKELRPDAKIFVLYRDMRTFAFKELYYKQARELGVQFLRYDPERKPEVAPAGEALGVTVFDQNLQAPVSLTADYLVLSAAVRPNPEAEEIQHNFKLPLDADGFFMEAHAKLRPLDVSFDGIFLCGLAHGPKYAEECVSQANGAAVRALRILSREKMWVGGAVTRVIKSVCAECLTCVRSCPFGVPTVDPKAHAAVIDPAKCHGCGVCAAECPHRAIVYLHNRDEQILSQIENAFANCS